LIGIEPSAILTFRDEYIRLADDNASAEKLAKNLTVEEVFKITVGKINSEQFSDEEENKNSWTLPKKSLSSIEATLPC
jgi:type 1 glutamine amidotransferase